MKASNTLPQSCKTGLVRPWLGHPSQAWDQWNSYSDKLCIILCKQRHRTRIIANISNHKEQNRVFGKCEMNLRKRLPILRISSGLERNISII